MNSKQEFSRRLCSPMGSSSGYDTDIQGPRDIPTAILNRPRDIVLANRRKQVLNPCRTNVYTR